MRIEDRQGATKVDNVLRDRQGKNGQTRINEERRGRAWTENDRKDRQRQKGRNGERHSDNEIFNPNLHSLLFHDVSH